MHYFRYHWTLFTITNFCHAAICHAALILQMAIFKPCILVTQRQDAFFSGALHPATSQLSCRAITAHTLKRCS